MKVLFIGGTGIISTAVSELAVKKGFELYLLNRGTRNEFAPKEAKLINSDIREPENTAKALKNHEFDVVVDWIAYVPEHIKADINLFKGKIGQYIFISSASAYQRPPENYIINETTPLSNPYWQYSRDKIACEEYLAEEYENNKFPYTIVRPSYTYSKITIPFIFNSKKHRWTLIDRIKKSKKIIVPGDGTSLFTLTHSKDFAKGFVGLIGNKNAIGHAFHITSDEVLTWNQIIDRIGDAAGTKPDIIHIPSEFISAFSVEHAGGLLGDKSVSVVFDNSKIKSYVPDFKATIPFSEGICQCVEWYESNPDMCSIDNEFNSLSGRIISAYQTGLKMAESIYTC